MNFDKLIGIVDKAYPDGLVMQYYRQPMLDHGDTLAKFIVSELKDTFDPEASSCDQISEAIRVMEVADEELLKVIAALYEAESDDD